MHVVSSAPRFKTDFVAGNLRLIIPSRLNWFIVLFLSAWLIGWGVGEVSAVQSLLKSSGNSPELFLIAWLVMWTIGGIYALGTILWQFGGREIITVGPNLLEYRVEAFGLHRTRQFTLAEIANLRVTDYTPGSFSNQAAWAPPLKGSGHGPLAFDYGARTFRIGPSLEEAEARMLLNQITTYLPRKLDHA